MLFLRTLAAIAIVTLSTAEGDARPATVSDFAVCNHEAAASTGGSAMPGHGGPRKPPTSVAPSAPVKPDDPVRTDPSGKLIVGSSDVLSEGMDATRAADQTYASAYRRCMAQRGITARPMP